MMKKLFAHKTASADLQPQELAQRRAAGEELVLLDVRQPDEYAQGHVKGSTLIPLDQLSLRLSDVPRDRPVVAMCRSGSRSSVALALLKRAGYTNVANLAGGMLAWEQQRLPVERGR
ncbi:MAG: rhodanese-like domain-containing protein [Herpetosiphon sp.]